MNFKELRKQSGMNLTQFSKYFGIPYRTIQNWDLGIRQCPEYLLDLMKYKLNHEKHGQWNISNELFLPHFKCSVCGYMLPMVSGENAKQFTGKFCSECGAKMDVSEKSKSIKIENPTYHTRCSECGTEVMCLDSVKDLFTDCPCCGAKLDK